MINKSTTLDGCKHLETGLNFIRTGKCCEGIDNTPMTAINSAPAFLMNKIFNINISCKSELQPPSFTYRFIPNKLVMLAIGFPTILIGLLGAIYLFKFATKLFNEKAGLISLFFYSFSPNIIAHSTINTQDATMVVMSLIAIYYFYCFYKNESTKNAVKAGIFLGFALSTKLNAILLYPSYLLIFFLNFILSKKNISFSRLFLIFFLGLFILNFIYLFDGTFLPFSSYNDSQFKSPLFLNFKKYIPENIPLFLPTGYLVGLDNIGYNNTHGWGGYLFGKYIPAGSFLYFAVVLLIKTPVPTLFLFLVYLFTKKKNLDEIFVLVPLFVYLGFNLFLNRLALGLRFLLVVYPLIFILVSNTVVKLWKKAYVIPLILIFWYLVSTIRVVPHYLAYFNEFVGGPKNGYKYLADSNIDWGQENFLLEDYIKKTNKKIFKNPGCEYTSGLIAVNLNSLMGVSGNPGQDNSDCYLWIKSYPVIDRIGYTWFIYDTDQ